MAEDRQIYGNKLKKSVRTVAEGVLKKGTAKSYLFYNDEKDLYPASLLCIVQEDEIVISVTGALTLNTKSNFNIVFDEDLKPEKINTRPEDHAIPLMRIQYLREFSNTLVTSKIDNKFEGRYKLNFILSALTYYPAIAASIEAYLIETDPIIEKKHEDFYLKEKVNGEVVLEKLCYHNKGFTKPWLEDSKPKSWTDAELRFFCYAALVAKDKSGTERTQIMSKILELRAIPFDSMLRSDIKNKLENDTLPYSTEFFQDLNKWFDPCPLLKTALYHGVMSCSEPEMESLKKLMEWNQLNALKLSIDWLHAPSKTLLHIQKDLVPQIKSLIRDIKIMKEDLPDANLFHFYKYLFPTKNPVHPEQYPDIYQAGYQLACMRSENFKANFKPSRYCKKTIHNYDSLFESPVDEEIIINKTLTAFDTEIADYYRENMNLDITKLKKPQQEKSNDLDDVKSLLLNLLKPKEGEK